MYKGDIMKFIKKLCCFLPAIFSIIGWIITVISKELWFQLSCDSSFHFNLITVNALFGGFLYTNYSLLIGILDHPIIKKVEKTDIIKKRNSHILRGIVCAVISVVSGILIVLFPSKCTPVQFTIVSFFENAEIIFMAFLIIYFLLSLYEMQKLIKAIHPSSDDEEVKEIDKLKEKFKKGK